MLKFANLTLSQKRFIVAVIEQSETAKETKQITLKECGAIYDNLRSNRQGAKGEKIGYPNWLFKANKLERGLYAVPVPTEAELSAYAKELAVKQTSPVAKAKAKVAKLAVKTKAAPVQATDADEDEQEISGSRLNKIIEESLEYDADVEDFNAILRENGIEI